jgi:transcriptional regulator with XRE-family HTH domain
VEVKSRKQQLVLIGRQVRRLRAARGYTHEQLAGKARFSRPYFSAVERGERNVSALNLVRIAVALGVEVGALFPPVAELLDSETLATQELVEDGKEFVEDEGKQQGGEGETSVAVPPQRVITQPGETLMSAGVAAQALGVNIRTLERWVKAKVLTPATQVETLRGAVYSVFWPADIERLKKTRLEAGIVPRRPRAERRSQSEANASEGGT